LVCFFNIVFVWHQCGVLIFGWFGCYPS
jgi:hypothetical protein